GAGARRSRCCTRRSARSGLRPGRRSIGRCWRAPREGKIEGGSVVRLDSTATAARMHQPSDSSLLWDGVRVMVRLLKQAQAWLGEGARAWHDHPRAAKKPWQAIEYTRGQPKRVPLYRALIKIVHATLAYLRAVAT